MKELHRFEDSLARNRKALASACGVASQYRVRLFPGEIYDSRTLLGNVTIKYPREEAWPIVALTVCSYWLRQELSGRVQDSAWVLAVAYCQCFAVLEDEAMQKEVWEVLSYSASKVEFQPEVRLSAEGQGKLGALLAIFAVAQFGIEACLDISRQDEILEAMPLGFASEESLAGREGSFRQYASSLLN